MHQADRPRSCPVHEPSSSSIDFFSEIFHIVSFLFFVRSFFQIPRIVETSTRAEGHGSPIERACSVSCSIEEC
jgi:hypothetical protein